MKLEDLPEDKQALLIGHAQEAIKHQIKAWNALTAAEEVMGYSDTAQDELHEFSAGRYGSSVSPEEARRLAEQWVKGAEGPEDDE